MDADSCYLYFKKKKKHSLRPMSTYRRSIFAFRGHKKDFYNTQEKYLLYWMLMALLMHSSL